MKQRFKRIEAGRQSVCHRVLLALLWVVGGSAMLSVPAQSVPDCNTAEENADWRYTCYQQDGANTLQWMPLLAAQGDEPVLKAITNIGDAANTDVNDVYNTSGYRLPYVQELALLLGFDTQGNFAKHRAFATVPYMHTWFDLPDTGANPVARRLLSATNNGSKQRLMMSLADGTVTTVEITKEGVIPDNEQTTVAILVRNFPAQFRIAVNNSSQCVTADDDKVAMAVCSSDINQLWRYHIASGCLHLAAEQEHANKCLGLTGSTVVNLTGEGGVHFVGQHIKLSPRYLRVVGSNVNWKGDPNEATSFTLLPP